MIRDTILGIESFTFNNHHYLTVALFTTIVVLVFRKHIICRQSYVLFADALGLGVFALITTHSLLGMGIDNVILIVSLSVITAVGGGVIRDGLIGEVPLVFRKELYASLAGLGSIGYILWYENFGHNLIVVISLIFAVAALRIYSIQHDLNLPKVFAAPNK